MIFQELKEFLQTLALEFGNYLSNLLAAALAADQQSVITFDYEQIFDFNQSGQFVTEYRVVGSLAINDPGRGGKRGQVEFV
jgi:hypothetical protein